MQSHAAHLEHIWDTQYIFISFCLNLSPLKLTLLSGHRGGPWWFTVIQIDFIDVKFYIKFLNYLKWIQRSLFLFIFGRDSSGFDLMKETLK